MYRKHCDPLDDNRCQSDKPGLNEFEEHDDLTCDELLRQQINSLDIDDEMLLRLGEDSEVYQLLSCYFHCSFITKAILRLGGSRRR